MSLTTKLVLFAGFIFFMLLMAASYRKRRKRIIFFGDSLTELGALYGGYIQRLNTYLNDADLAEKFELIGMGKSGDKIADLQKRLSKDILERGTEMVIILIGVNDVWHKYTHNTGTPADTFIQVYNTIVEKLNAASVKIVVCTPPLIGENINQQTQVNIDLENICTEVRKLAAHHELPLVDLRVAFRNYLSENNPENAFQGILTNDGIHLNEKGNQLIASEIWKVLEEDILLKER